MPSTCIAYPFFIPDTEKKASVSATLSGPEWVFVMIPDFGTEGTRVKRLPIVFFRHTSRFFQKLFNFYGA